MVMLFRRDSDDSGRKKTPPFWIFIAPFTITLAVGFPLLPKYPLPIAGLLLSLCVVFSLVFWCLIYVGLKNDSYARKHHFELWKKTKTLPLRARMEAARELTSLLSQVPSLVKLGESVNRFVFIVLAVWILIFICVFSFILFSALSN